MPPPRTATRVAALVLLLSTLLPAATPAELAWRKLATSPVNTFRHDDVFFVDPLVGWVVNLDGAIYKTTDGGASWNLLLQQRSLFRCVGFATPDKGWVGNVEVQIGCFSGVQNDPNVLYATTDGGTTWAPVTNIPEPLPKGLCSISVVSEDVVFAAGRVCDTPRVIRSTDGGATWTTLDLSPWATRLIDCRFTDALDGFVVGGLDDSTGVSQTLILHTTDGGDSWQTAFLTIGETERWCWKLTAPTASVMYASVQINDTASAPYILKSTDGGATWAKKAIPPASYFEQGIGFATATTGWIGGDTDTWQTTDGGDTWAVIDIGTPSNDDNVNRFRFLAPTLGYAVGRRVYKYSDDAAVGAPVLAGNEDDVWLAPPAPNPATGATRFDYDVRVAGHVRIALYGVGGREVARLVDASQPVGHYSASLPEGRLAAGIYLARLESTAHDECRKVVLLR